MHACQIRHSGSVTEGLCPDIYSTNEMFVVTLKYKKLCLLSVGNLQRGDRAAESHEIHNHSTNIQSATARRRGSDQPPLWVCCPCSAQADDAEG